MDPRHLIETFGTIGILAIVFAESGLLIGFFLPGDSLLFTAGLIASQNNLDIHLNIAVLAIGCPLAAIAGDQVGYLFGRRVGPALFRRPDARFFKQRNLDLARDYFDRHGAGTIVLARFVPVVRTFAPMVAGAARMRWRTFVTFNVIGGVLWGCGAVVAGYVLGKSIPNPDRWVVPIVIVIFVLSFVPVIKEGLKLRRQGQADRLVEAKGFEGHE